MAKRLTVNNKKLFAQARRYLVGGVDSPVRSFNYVGGDPVLIKRGKGALVYDYDGNAYIDYVISWGAAILGHAHPDVVRDTERAIERGFHFGTTNETEVALAAAICEAIPIIKKIRFVNSGTEAVMGAIRLARAVTKRDKVVKFENAYHGHADYLLAKGGSGLATLKIPTSAGVPREFIDTTIIASYGKIDELERIFKSDGDNIAAVIVEPVGGNYGVIAPDKKFLHEVRRLTKKYGALLIFDEVITGLRFDYGSCAEKFNIAPDLICLGKIIGGGLPIGSYGGRADIMDRLAPLGDVYQASTFGGNPVVMQAGLSTLRVLKKEASAYVKSARRTQKLALAIDRAGSERGIGLKTEYYGSMFSMRFKNKEIFKRFYHAMLDAGVYFAPSEYEVNFLSFAHNDANIDKTIEKICTALTKAKGGLVYGSRKY